MKRRIRGMVCPQCKDFVFSRARHDMRSCTCKAIAVDGGREYLKVSWDPSKTHITPSTYRYITQSDAVLLRDWNFSKDKYGIIKAKKRKVK